MILLQRTDPIRTASGGDEGEQPFSAKPPSIYSYECVCSREKISVIIRYRLLCGIADIPFNVKPSTLYKASGGGTAPRSQH
ncbi:hypothetical protein FKM82_021563 [Ascaphus truei]